MWNRRESEILRIVMEQESISTIMLFGKGYGLKKVIFIQHYYRLYN